MEKSLLHQEWQLLQNQCDSYEKYGLIIKLTALCVFAAALIYNHFNYGLLLLLCIFWLQEGIWKTFQSRIEKRLLTLESAIADQDNEAIAFQFQSQFLANRPGQAKLIVEYIAQSIRPTVAFPYLILCALVLISIF